MTGPTGATPSQQTANPKAGGSKDVPKNDDKQGAKQAKSKKELQETITNAGAGELQIIPIELWECQDLPKNSK